MPQPAFHSDPRILNRRTLGRDHRRLAELLQPGMSVLDVGCGTGAITAGIANVIGPEGAVLGIDRDNTLLNIAKQDHDIHNLRFELIEVLSMEFEGCFHIVTAARTLQWISDTELAVRRMKRAARSGGLVIVLDYNHENNSWAPLPPFEFRHFYRKFLEWRNAHNWNNRIADHLPALFRASGLEGIQTSIDDEIIRRGDPDFSDAAAIWTHVIQTLGPSIVAGGFLDECECLAAEACYREWAQTDLIEQTLAMRTVLGTVP